jgi:L-alanine-DL-glutamate epimerase-like enolase superfamily enzyme
VSAEAVKVQTVRTVQVSMPVHEELVVSGARGVHDRSDFLIVEVTTSDGVTGIGEVSATPLWSGEDATTAEHWLTSVLHHVVIGQPLFPVAARERELDRVLAGNPFTKAGLSTALWDAAARTLDVSLATLLGGPLRTEIPIKCSLSGEGAVLDATYRAGSRAGFQAFKVKVGLGVEGDLARVARVRELAGPGARLGVDANGGWSRTEAQQALPALLEMGIEFVEQPLPPGDLEGLRQLRGRGIPIVLDESVFDMPDLVRVLDAEAADVVSVYVGKAGGPARAVELARVAAAFGVDVVIGSNGEMGVGAAAQASVAAAAPGLTTSIGSDIIGAHYYREDVLCTPLDSDGRRVRVPEGAGLGVALLPSVWERVDRDREPTG